MKAFAARIRDIDDLRLLADIVGIDSSATALQICAEFFPREDVPPRSRLVTLLSVSSHAGTSGRRRGDVGKVAADGTAIAGDDHLGVYRVARD